MIAIFTTKEEAQKFADKCFQWLQQNCPSLNGTCWQEPVKNPKEEQYYVQIPQEWEKDYYPVKEKISVVCDKEIKFAIAQFEKVPADWSVEKIEDIKK